MTRYYSDTPEWGLENTTENLGKRLADIDPIVSKLYSGSLKPLPTEDLYAVREFLVLVGVSHRFYAEDLARLKANRPRTFWEKIKYVFTTYK